MPHGLPNGLELHPPFPQEIGTMCGLGKGAARRLWQDPILAPASRLARRPALSPASRVGFSELLGGGECHPSLLACVFGNP